PQIQGDATFKNVPVGIDPTTWPLDIDYEATEKAAKKDPIYPGGTIKVFGNFCWAGNASRAEIYMVPKSQTPPPSIAAGSRAEGGGEGAKAADRGGEARKGPARRRHVRRVRPAGQAKFPGGQGRQHARPHRALRQPGPPLERHHRRQDPQRAGPRGAAPLRPH